MRLVKKLWESYEAGESLCDALLQDKITTNILSSLARSLLFSVSKYRKQYPLCKVNLTPKSFFLTLFAC